MTGSPTAFRHEIPSADGTMIPVYSSGAGRPLVLVHGAMSTHRAWEPLRPFLEPYATVITLDRRSVLGEPHTRYCLEREFEDVAAVANSAGSEVDLLGHSAGAVCALGAAPLIPNLRRLILYEPPFLGDAGLALAARLDGLHRQNDLRAVIETFLREGPGASQAFVEAVFALPDWEELARCLPREVRALASWRPVPAALAAVNARVLLLLGGETPPGHLHRAYVQILNGQPNLEIREIPGQRHGAPLLAPKQFADIVLGFLKEEA